MHSITRTQFTEILATSVVRLRLKRELRFVPEEILNWENRDFLAVMNKSGSEGVLIIPDDGFVVLPFALQARKPNPNGRVEAIICDICATWQRGTHSASITFPKEKSSVTFLVCGDLDCSLHVRDMTDASKLSRTQLREHIDTKARIARLRERLARIVATLQG